MDRQLLPKIQANEQPIQVAFKINLSENYSDFPMNEA
jgi:hypothetical protein